MLENPWSAVGNPTRALGTSGSSFGPSSLAPVGIHHILLSNLTSVSGGGKGGILSELLHACCVVYDSCAQSYAHKYEQFLNSCLVGVRLVIVCF